MNWRVVVYFLKFFRHLLPYYLYLCGCDSNRLFTVPYVSIRSVASTLQWVPETFRGQFLASVEPFESFRFEDENEYKKEL